MVKTQTQSRNHTAPHDPFVGGGVLLFYFRPSAGKEAHGYTNSGIRKPHCRAGQSLPCCSLGGTMWSKVERRYGPIWEFCGILRAKKRLCANRFLSLGSGIITNEPRDNSDIIWTILTKIREPSKVLRYCYIRANNTLKSLGTGNHLTAVGYETSQKRSTTTMYTRGAAVSSGR